MRLQVFMCMSHLFGPASYSVGVGRVMMCLCFWALAHPRSRHLYNSICLTVKSGRAPAKTLAPCQNSETETEMETYVWATTEPKLISEQRSHLQPSHNSHSSSVFYYSVKQNQSLNLTAARRVKVYFL